MVTKKQQLVLDFIEKYQKKNKYSPTLEEIQRKFKLASVSTAHYYIQQLKNKKLLSKQESQHRSINVLPSNDMVRIRLLGTIAAGQPIEAIEEFETITIPSNLISSAEHFALNVRGDSMIGDGIFDGDTVIIKKQNTAQDGDTVVALLNENEVTLKRIYKIANGFRLQPANPTMPAFDVKELIVQGKVISVMRNYDKRKSLNELSNLNNFSTELKHFIIKIQGETKDKFKPNKEFNLWSKTEDKPDENKFFLETSYTFLNEILLLWVCKDKKLLDFEIIKDNKQLLVLKNEAQKIYSHIFSSNIFDWYTPENFLLQEITNLFNKYDFSSVDRDILGKLYEQFITTEERAEALRESARTLGLNLDKFEDGLFTIYEQPISSKIISLQDAIQTIKRKKIKRVVLDSITLFEYIQPKDEMELRKTILSFILNMGNMGVTLLATSERNTTDIDRFSYKMQDFLFEGLIILTKIRKGASFERALTVAKMRSQDHLVNIFPFSIGKGGIEVYSNQIPLSLIDNTVKNKWKER